MLTRAPEVLAVARSVLEHNSLTTRVESIEGTSTVGILAESDDLLAIVVASETISDGVALADQAQAHLTNLAAAHDLGPKMWDLYTILLIDAVNLNAAELAAVHDLSYNLTATRKLVRTGIGPSEVSLREALAPILPLEVSPSVGKNSPIQSMLRELKLAGIDATTAENAVRSFEAGGQVMIP